MPVKQDAAGRAVLDRAEWTERPRKANLDMGQGSREQQMGGGGPAPSKDAIKPRPDR